MKRKEKKTVLVVDDDTAVTIMSKRLLERSCNADVITANTAEKGIEIISEKRGKIAVLVSDWDIPVNGEGAGVISAAKEAGINHIVAWSGNANIEKMMKAGASFAINKTAKDIVQTICTILGDLENQPPTNSQ